MKITRFLACAVAVLALTVGAKADNLVLNPDFFATSTGYPGYTSPGSNVVSNWTIVNGGSNTSAGPFWDNGTAAGHTTVGFLQGALGNTATATQVLNLVAGQTYAFSFLENSRNCCGYNNNGINLTTAQAYPALTLSYDGVVISTTPYLASVGGSNPFIFVSGTFTATSTGPGNLTFSSLSPGDGTSLVTGVSVTAVTPEPSSLMLLGTGLVGAVGMARRKFRKA